MAKLQPVRGTHDLIGDDARRHRAVVEAGRAVAGRYGYDEIATPVFEFTEVFARTLGDTSDVVTKEMYTFADRGGDSLTLRPENTAGVARAFLSGGMQQHAPVRLFYAGPMFRYERPQKGRMRQFHQIGVELIGAPEPLADVEVIACGAATLRALGIADGVTLELNTLGDPASRGAYRERLVAYLERYRHELSVDSRARLERNPLRILDSKDEGDRRVLSDAPSMADSLNDDSRAFFDSVLAGLDALGVGYRLNPQLVRGLDYYTHTAFEFTTTALGAQGTLLAGGRYDGLIGQMGGPETPGVGWAAGVERMAMLLAEPPGRARPVAVVPLGDEAVLPALQLAEGLRADGIAADMAFRGQAKQRLKRATRVNARYAVLLGADELARDVVQLRDLDAGEQAEVALAGLGEQLRRRT